MLEDNMKLWCGYFSNSRALSMRLPMNSSSLSSTATSLAGRSNEDSGKSSNDRGVITTTVPASRGSEFSSILDHSETLVASTPIALSTSDANSKASSSDRAANRTMSAAGFSPFQITSLGIISRVPASCIDNHIFHRCPLISHHARHQILILETRYPILSATEEMHAVFSDVHSLLLCFSGRCGYFGHIIKLFTFLIYLCSHSLCESTSVSRLCSTNRHVFSLLPLCLFLATEFLGDGEVARRLPLGQRP